MSLLKKTLLTLIMLLMVVSFVACEKEGTAEAKVMEMKYHAEADGIRDKAEAMKIFDAVGKLPREKRKVLVDAEGDRRGHLEVGVDRLELGEQRRGRLLFSIGLSGHTHRARARGISLSRGAEAELGDRRKEHRRACRLAR